MSTPTDLEQHSKEDELPGLESSLDALRASPEFTGPVEGFDEHESNDHFALLYESQEEQFDAAIPFIRQGLERGEHCLYVADENSKAEVLEAMRAADVDVDVALESGALTIHTKQATYLRGGTFDRDAMLEFWEHSLEQATDEEGYTGIRAAAEMTWALDGDTSLDLLAEYEAVLNDLYEDEDYTVLCQYNREQFPATVIHDVIKTHPHLIHDGAVYNNDYYEPPEEFFGPVQPANEVDRKLGTLKERSEAKLELKQHHRYLREQNAIMASPDRSFEEKLQALFDLGCERFDLELGAIARVDTDADWFEVEYVSDDHEHFEPGVELPLSETYCTAATEIKAVGSVTDPHEEGYDDITVYQEFGLQAYLGAYIRVDGGTDRTFFFVTSEPRDKPFSSEERTFHQLLGQWVKYELERQQREVELQETKDHFKRVFESSHDAIFVFDPEADEFVDVNPAAYEMLGYTRDELLSLDPSDVYPDNFDKFQTFIDEVCDDGAGWTDELTYRTKDGSRLPAEISASRIEYDDRPFLLAAVRDISERKESEQSQRRLYEITADPDRTFDEKCQALFELGCKRFDLEHGGIARINPETDLFEVETISGDHKHLVPGKQYPLSETYCRLVTDDGETASVTDPVSKRFEGKLCYERFGVQAYLGTHIEVDGDIDRTLFFVSSESRDHEFSDEERTFHHLMGQWVSYELERRQTKEALEETVSKLERSNAELEQFAYAASHDLQEPLRMVSSYLQLLENRYADDLDGDAQEFIDFAVDGADRMREMIDALLTYSRLDRDGDDFEPVDCAVVLDEARDNLQIAIEESDAEITSDALPTVIGDEQQLVQLFQNLLDNAITYAGDEPPRIHIEAETSNGEVVLSVRDNGIGIDSEKLEEIFEVFNRLHTTDEYAGAGIGLALCQRIVEIHNGRMWVDSDPGEGSTFLFTIPEETEKRGRGTNR